MNIAILFPEAWGRPRILRAVQRLAVAIPSAEIDAHNGKVNEPCVDCEPTGAESVISRLIAADS